MNVLAIATEKEWTAAILYDDPENSPRKRDNLGTMVCWHRKYKLGDEHGYSTPEDFLHVMVYKMCTNKEIIAYAKAAKGAVKIEKSDNSCSVYCWRGKVKEWVHEGNYEDEDELIDAIVENSWISDCESLLSDKMVILPLYLYDHSEITMNCSDFNDPWDSCQVGFIYVTNEDIKREYGELSETAIEKAETVLRGEVDIYDQYLRGEVFGIITYKFDEKQDSCWDFYGELDELADEAGDFLPDDVRNSIVEKLKSCEYVGELDLNDYFGKHFKKTVLWSLIE